MGRKSRSKSRERKPAWKKFVESKTPRIEEDPSSDTKLFCWQISNADQDGPFGWQVVTERNLWKEIFDKLGDYETLTWVEAQQTGRNHQVAKQDLIGEAQKRLREIGLDDYDHLFSLHLSGLKRVWGIRNKNALQILWWDPEHKICPSIK